MMREISMFMGNIEPEIIEINFPWITKKIWNYRNLIFIGLIWIVIGLHSYFEYLMMWEHYDWATSGVYNGESAETEREYRDAILKPGKISVALSGTLWGLFFTGYFLNSHVKVMKKD